MLAREFRLYSHCKSSRKIAAGPGAKCGLTKSPSPSTCTRPTLSLPYKDQIVRSAGYAIAVAYSYTLMLLFMTYNAYV